MGLPGQGVESPGNVWASHRGSEQRSEQGSLSEFGCALRSHTGGRNTS